MFNLEYFLTCTHRSFIFYDRISDHSLLGPRIKKFEMYNSHFKHNIHMCRLSKGSDILHASYRVLIFDSPGKLESRYDYEHFKFAASDWKWLLYANVKSRAIKKQMKAFVNINIVYEKDNTEKNRKHTFFSTFIPKDDLSTLAVEWNIAKTVHVTKKICYRYQMWFWHFHDSRTSGTTFNLYLPLHYACKINNSGDCIGIKT